MVISVAGLQLRGESLAGRSVGDATFGSHDAAPSIYCLRYLPLYTGRIGHTFCKVRSPRFWVASQSVLVEQGSTQWQGLRREEMAIVTETKMSEKRLCAAKFCLASPSTGWHRKIDPLVAVSEGQERDLSCRSKVLIASERSEGRLKEDVGEGLDKISSLPLLQ